MRALAPGFGMMLLPVPNQATHPDAGIPSYVRDRAAALRTVASQDVRA